VRIIRLACGRCNVLSEGAAQEAEAGAIFRPAMSSGSAAGKNRTVADCPNPLPRKKLTS